MPNTNRGFLHRTKSLRRDPDLNRLCIGVLGLFPMITALLMTIVESLPIAAIIAGSGAVTFMSLLPRRNRPRS